MTALAALRTDVRPERRIWVVEMRAMKGSVWTPVECALKRREAVWLMESWHMQNPDDQVRVVAYRPGLP